ncbi:glycosyltransferase family 2 protein [Loktanella sp. M215]|uniref:glycosyltransferase family 2 protein n=1 Tax=Loktanella sp. M215 TaxID=2675431 RepID=UPI001F19232A|nr:glycosyltransferase family 2 protein [Loktanella sp. M215]MCF7702209.1 glycosyltransferase [Loktanella sp. M215]
MTLPTLGVVVVTFNSADIIQDCLESLLASRGVRLEIIVVDNASTDDTLAVLRDWASGQHPYTVPADMPFALTPAPKPVTLLVAGTPTQILQDHTITLITAKVNGGFAAGVNQGLAALAGRPQINRFWVLNPDSAVPPETAAAFATHGTGDFALMGGRVLYYDDPDTIQIDGGTVNRRTGITGNLNLFRTASQTSRPDPATMDFITGASMVASRAFYEAAGPMPENYFLYYEEVDWAFRRGTRGLAYCPDAIVYHKAGTAIGSATMNRPASAFSQYFKHRARMLFMRRYFPTHLPVALAYSFAKAAQLAMKGYRKEAKALLMASLNRPPPPEIRNVLSQEAARLAFPALKR